MEKILKPDLNQVIGDLQDAVAHAGSVHSAAKDFIKAIHDHKAKGEIVIDAVVLGQNGFAAFNDLMALTHPHLIK